MKSCRTTCLGPLGASWRSGNSTWSLATDEELDAARAHIERMRSNGTLRKYFDERESRRLKVG